MQNVARRFNYTLRVSKKKEGGQSDLRETSPSAYTKPMKLCPRLTLRLCEGAELKLGSFDSNMQTQ